MALGTALSMLFSQMISWPLSFIAPVFTMFILALPLRAPRLKAGITFMVALLLPLVAGLAILPFLHHARWVGVLLIALGLYYSFYYTARGGSPVLGNFMTIGLTVMVTVGSVSIEIMLPLIGGLAAGAAAGLCFVWLAHALIPEAPAITEAKPKPARPAPAPEIARRNAWRSMVITFPVALVFLFLSASPTYTVVMIKVASMGQQANVDQSRKMANSLILSTVLGGLGAIVGWQILSIWPSLLMYTLLIALASLIYGRGIFKGEALHPKFSMWSYALLTMIVILAPAVTDSMVGSDAGAAFWWRLFLFFVIAIYGRIAVAVFDAFWSGTKNRENMAENQSPVGS